MTMHELGAFGRYVARYSDTAETVTITDVTAPGWKFLIRDECGFSDLVELMETALRTKATHEELQFLLNVAAGAEAIIQHAPYVYDHIREHLALAFRQGPPPSPLADDTD